MGLFAKLRIIAFLLFALFSFGQSNTNNVPARAVVLCGSGSFSSRSSGDGGKSVDRSIDQCGDVPEMERRNYLWYKFTTVETGTLGFTITPEFFGVDFDFYIYKTSDAANFDNPNGVVPIRCSYAATNIWPRNTPSGKTGLSASATDISENERGDGFLKLLDVKPGETYYMLINRFEQYEVSFQIEFSGGIIDSGKEPFAQVPRTNNPNDLELCDIGNNDSEAFNLNTVRNQMTITPNATTITFHANLADASNLAHSLPDSYTNTSSPQTLYARSTSNAEDKCFEIKEFNLKLNITPQALTEATSLVECSDDANVERLSFDLADAIPSIIDKPEDYTIGFYASLQDAQSDKNKLTTSYTNTSNPQNIAWMLTLKETGCHVSGGLTLRVKPPLPQLVSYTDILPSCDSTEDGDDENGVTFFDLTSVESTLSQKLPQGSYSYAYYQTREGALYDTQPIADAKRYINSSSPVSQPIFISIKNTQTKQCAAVGNFLKVTVNPLPKQTLLSSMPIYCTEGNNNYATLGKNLGDNITYLWNSGEKTPELIITRAGDFFVETTNSITGCKYVSNTLVVKESSIPYADISGGTMFAPEQRLEVSPILKGITIPEYQIDDSGFQDSNIFENVLPGKHVIAIRDKNGCGTRYYNINVIGYNTLITPNGDGFNDRWVIEDFYDQINTVDLFDRMGRHIASINPKEGWDGQSNGIEMFSSDYWFKMSYKDTDGTVKIIKSNITLKR